MFVVGASVGTPGEEGYRAVFEYWEDSEEEQARLVFDKYSSNDTAFIAYVLSRATKGKTETFAMVFGEEVPTDDEQD